MITNKESVVKENLGKYGFFEKHPQPSALVGDCTYLGGLEDPENVDLTNIKSLFLFNRPKGFQVTFNKGIGNIYFYWNFDQLINIKKQKCEEVFNEENKSVIARAIVGGLLLGPLGSVIGGMSGIGTKKVKDKTIPDYIISIDIQEDDKVTLLLFGVTESKINAVDQFFSNIKTYS